MDEKSLHARHQRQVMCTLKSFVKMSFEFFFGARQRCRVPCSEAAARHSRIIQLFFDLMACVSISAVQIASTYPPFIVIYYYSSGTC